MLGSTLIPPGRIARAAATTPRPPPAVATEPTSAVTVNVARSWAPTWRRWTRRAGILLFVLALLTAVLNVEPRDLSFAVTRAQPTADALTPRVLRTRGPGRILVFS